MSSSSDGSRRGSPEGRGAWLRLAVLVVIVALLLLSSAIASTGALLTDTTAVVGVVSTLEVFPTPGPVPTGG